MVIILRQEQSKNLALIRIDRGIDMITVTDLIKRFDVNHGGRNGRQMCDLRGDCAGRPADLSEMRKKEVGP